MHRYRNRYSFSNTRIKTSRFRVRKSKRSKCFGNKNWHRSYLAECLSLNQIFGALIQVRIYRCAAFCRSQRSYFSRNEFIIKVSPKKFNAMILLISSVVSFSFIFCLSHSLCFIFVVTLSSNFCTDM